MKIFALFLAAFLVGSACGAYAMDQHWQFKVAKALRDAQVHRQQQNRTK